MKKEILINQKTLETATIVDALYDQLLTNKLNTKYIKILVKFYDKNDNPVKPYLFLKDKNVPTRYKYHNYLYTKINSFIKKNVKEDIYKYEIKISIS